MASVAASAHFADLTPEEYKRRVRAWTMYDWANSAFATTILAAVLPVYYSQVAGATLPSEASATALWSMGLSFSLLIVAIMSPILGTISDIMRGKKRFLAIFSGAGILATGLLVLVSTGDWILASILFILGRIGFTAANVFYDALLPHVAHPEDQDRVSANGYAMGYIGGGILLAINIVMIFFIPDFIENAGSRLSLLSVAIWWAIFSIPIFMRVPEPPGTETTKHRGESVIHASFAQLRDTFSHMQNHRDLFRFLVAFLIYNDGIGTIIGIAAIYGAELGFGTIELISALLLVQFVGIPFSLIFGRLPSEMSRYRSQFLAFIVLNLVLLPVVGVVGLQVLPEDLTGAPPPPYVDTASALGEGRHMLADDGVAEFDGDWQEVLVPVEDLSGGGFLDFVSRVFGESIEPVTYMVSDEPSAAMNFAFNGEQVRVAYRIGPDSGVWAVLIDGQPIYDDLGEPIFIDATNDTVRFNVREIFAAEEPGEHILTIANSDRGQIEVASANVLPPRRVSNLGAVIGIIVAVNALAALLAALLGKPLFGRLAATMSTKRSIILSLIVFAVIAVWGYFLNSVIEFWFISWMVAIVLGGSQALSRSLYASMSPASKSGEFFGLFGVMEKFSSILGPILFAVAVTLSGSSRPAIFSLMAFFIIGIILLTRVDVEAGRKAAEEEDSEIMPHVHHAHPHQPPAEPAHDDHGHDHDHPHDHPHD